MKKPEYYQKLCARLASKYKSPWWQEDLVSEGLVAIYEELAKNPQSERVTQVARDAMWSYANIKTKPVTVPDGKEARGILRGEQTWIDKYSEYDQDALHWLELVLNGSHENIGEADVLVDGYDKEYEYKEFEEKIMLLADTKLTGTARKVFLLYFEQGFTQVEVSKMLGISQPAVVKSLTRSCVLLKKSLQNSRLTLL